MKWTDENIKLYIDNHLDLWLEKYFDIHGKVVDIKTNVQENLLRLEAIIELHEGHYAITVLLISLSQNNNEPRPVRCYKREGQEPWKLVYDSGKEDESNILRIAPDIEQILRLTSKKARTEDTTEEEILPFVQPTSIQDEPKLLKQKARNFAWLLGGLLFSLSLLIILLAGAKPGTVFDFTVKGTLFSFTGKQLIFADIFTWTAVMLLALILPYKILKTINFTVVFFFAIISPVFIFAIMPNTMLALLFIISVVIVAINGFSEWFLVILVIVGKKVFKGRKVPNIRDGLKEFKKPFLQICMAYLCVISVLTLANAFFELTFRNTTVPIVQRYNNMPKSKAEAIIASYSDAKDKSLRRELALITAYAYLFLGGVSLLFNLAFFVMDYIWRHRQIAMLDNLATSKIKSAALGLVELTGRARHRHDFSLDERLLFKEMRKTWYTYELPTSNNPVFPNTKDPVSKAFVLEDKTGHVLIDTEDVKSRQGFDLIKYLFFFLFRRFDTLGLREVLITNPQNDLGPHPFYRNYIMPGDNLYVLGTLEVNPNARKGSTGIDKLVVKARKRPKIGEALLGFIFGGFDYTNIFFITNSNEPVARKRLKKSTLVSFITNSLFILSSIYILYLGIELARLLDIGWVKEIIMR